MQKANLIIVNARFLTQPLTGVQRYAFECSMQMKKINPSIQFVSPKNILQQEWAEELGVRIIGANKGHLWEQLDLWIFMRRHKDAILFNPCNTAPWLLKNQFVTIHDISFQRFPENNSLAFRIWYNFLIPRIAKRSLHTFTVSNTVKHELINFYHLEEHDVSVTYNGLPRNFETEHEKPIQKEKIILTVGAISKRKNTKLLADAFITSTLVNDYTLVIIGNKSNVFANQELPTHEKINWIQSCTDKELIDFYRRAELFVSLSEYEGFGMPVLEAIYFQCKVICLNMDTYRELFKEYVYFCDASINRLHEFLITMSQRPLPQIDTKKLTHTFSYQQSAQHILSILTKTYIK